jgi:hypothetical protein
MSLERGVWKFVTAQDDPRLGPAHPDLSYDPLHFFRTVGAGVYIGAAQARTAGDRRRRLSAAGSSRGRSSERSAPFLLAAERHVGVRSDPE